MIYLIYLSHLKACFNKIINNINKKINKNEKLGMNAIKNKVKVEIY